MFLVLLSHILQFSIAVTKLQNFYHFYKNEVFKTNYFTQKFMLNDWLFLDCYFKILDCF